jgi:predicted RNA methylase
MQGRKIHPRPTLRAREAKEKEGFVRRKNHETKVPAAPAAAVRARRTIDCRQRMIHDVGCGCGEWQIRVAMNVAEEMPVITSSQVSVGSAWLKARRERES